MKIQNIHIVRYGAKETRHFNLLTKIYEMEDGTFFMDMPQFDNFDRFSGYRLMQTDVTAVRYYFDNSMFD